MSRSHPTAGSFTSSDPLVADVANAIEERYPGHVMGVNITVDGHEIDILTGNAIIEVKQGGSGLVRQVVNRQALDKPVIGYSPRLGRHAIRAINEAGGIGTDSLDDLLAAIAP